MAATNLLTGTINWDNYKPVAIPQSFNLGAVKDVPTLNAALKGGQINRSQWMQRFQQIQPKINGVNTPKAYSSGNTVSALGSAINKTLVQPTVQTVTLPATGIARDLPGGTNDIKAQTQASNQSALNANLIIQMQKAGKISKQSASKILQANAAGASDNNASLAQTLNSLPSKKALAAGFAGLAGDILTGGKGFVGSRAAAATGLDEGTNDLVRNATTQRLIHGTNGDIPVKPSALDALTDHSPAPLDKSTPVSNKSSAAAVEQGNGTKTKLTTPLNEAGTVKPGEATAAVQDLIAKHQKATAATGTIESDYAKTVGRTKAIDEDVATSLKNRTNLSASDKQAILDYRDAKAAGVTPEALPSHLQQADTNITALNKATQKAEAERATLEGHPEKAAQITARNPETYTHREALGKGSNLEQAIQGRRNSASSLGTLGRQTSSSKGRKLFGITDEEGNRSTVLVDKNKITKLENGGKTRTELGNLNLKKNQDFLDNELKPYQTKVANLQKEGDALSKVKVKGGASDNRITKLAQKVALLEDPENLTELTKPEAKSLRDAKLKLKELTNVKNPSTNAEGRLKTINQHLIDMNNQISKIHNKYDPDTLEEKSFVGKDGKKYTFGQGITSEITKNSGQKYLTDPELTTHLNYSDAQKSLEHARFIENTKSILEDKGLAVKEGEAAPKGFEKTSNPYFPGYKLDPKIAEQLDDIATAAKKQGVVGTLASKTSELLRQTIVYLPIKHNFNELAGYTIDRGLSKLLSPVAYLRQGKALKAAYTAVVTHDDFYQKVLKSDFSLLGADDNGLTKVIQQQTKNVLDNPTRIKNFAKSLGMSPVRAYHALQQVSVFDAQDVLNLARIHERMQGTLFSKPMSLEDAIADTKKFNFQYKVPSRAALPGKAGRAVKETLGSDKVFFGAYTYDKYRIAKNVVKGTANLTHPKEALQAADKLAATVAISALVWPQVDKELQKVTGDKNAHATAPGVAAVPELAQKIINHTESPAAAAGSQISIAAPYSLGSQLLNNTDSFTKKHIWDPNDTEANKDKAVASWLKNQLPFEQKAATTKNASTNKTLSTALSLAGASLPKNAPAANKLNSLEYDTLPTVQTTAKAQGAKGNLSGAMGTIKNYNSKVLAAAKSDLKSQGRPIPDDQTLIKQLKKSGYYYLPKQTTIKGWSKPKKAVTGGFAP